MAHLVPKRGLHISQDPGVGFDIGLLQIRKEADAGGDISALRVFDVITWMHDKHERGH